VDNKQREAGLAKLIIGLGLVVTVADDLEEQLYGHDHDGDDECSLCNLAYHAEGISYSLSMFHSGLEGQTVDTLRLEELSKRAEEMLDAWLEADRTQTEADNPIVQSDN
jgi:hypothetical protein